jgi:hypothetical protein
MFAQAVSEPRQPRLPGGSTYATRPDFYGKSTFTFTTVFEHAPYCVQYLRASDIQILQAFYTTDDGGNPAVWTTQRIQDEIFGNGATPSRPVQLWFGEFLHGTLELSFRFWQDNRENYPFPWPCTQREWRALAPDWAPNDIGGFADIVETSLRQQGKQARSADARNSGFRRVALAVNQLGPHLFPLIFRPKRKS